jgi:hypothetical protein
VPIARIGEIIPYNLTDSDARKTNEAPRTTYPLIVVSVAKDDRTVDGTVFLSNGKLLAVKGWDLNRRIISGLFVND